jgi:hypothetical protein
MLRGKQRTVDLRAFWSQPPILRARSERPLIGTLELLAVLIHEILRRCSPTGGARTSRAQLASAMVDPH